MSRRIQRKFTRRGSRVSLSEVEEEKMREFAQNETKLNDSFRVSEHDDREMHLENGIANNKRYIYELSIYLFH